MFSRPAAALLAALALAACGDNIDVPGGVSPTAPFGRVRVVNAIADPATADTVNVAVDGVPFGVVVPYGRAVPTGGATYYPAYEGNRQLVAKRWRDTSVTAIDAPVAITADTSQTVYAVLNAGTPEPFVTLDNTALPGADSLTLRVTHLASAAGAVDVYVTAPDADISAAAPTFAGVAPRSATEYVRLRRGTYQVRLTAPGTKTVLLTASVAPPTGAAPFVRTVVALDPQTGTAPVASVLVDR